VALSTGHRESVEIPRRANGRIVLWGFAVIEKGVRRYYIVRKVLAIKLEHYINKEKGSDKLD